MRKFIKFYMLILALLFLLLLIASILLITVANPNDFKNQISQYVQKKTHRELTIHGDISWSFFPWIGFKVNDASLNNTAEFDSRKIFIHVDHADIRMRFLSLLHRQVEIDHLKLKGLSLNLVKNKAGKGNWEDLTHSPTTQTSTDITTAKDKKTKSMTISVSSFEAEDANVFYLNEQTGKIDQIRELQLKATQLNQGKPFPLTLKFQMRSNQPSVVANILLHSRAIINLNEQTYFLRNAELLITTWKPNEDSNQGLYLSLTGDITANLKQKNLSITRLKASLDDSNFEGYFNIVNFDTESINFDLAVDQINLDKYFVNKNTDTDNAGLNNQTPLVKNGNIPVQSASPQLSPYERLRKLNMEGNLRAGSLTIANMNLSNVITKISAHNGIIQVSPINANLYQGSFNGQFGMNIQGTVPSYAIQGSLLNVQASEFAKSNKLAGLADITTNLTMQGTDSVSLKQSMSGNAKFSVKNAVLNGIDIPFQLRRAQAFIKRQPEPTDNTKRTELGTFYGSGLIQHGVFRNNEVVMSSPIVQITGGGTSNFNNGALDYRLLASEIKNGKPSSPQIPFIVSGTFQNPMIIPDLQALVSGQVTQRIGELIDFRKQRQQEVKKAIRQKILMERLLHH